LQPAKSKELQSCHALSVVLRDNSDLARQLRVIEMLGPAPSQPVVVRSQLDDSIEARLRSVLFELPKAKLNDFLIQGFAPAPDYSSIAAFVGPRTS